MNEQIQLIERRNENKWEKFYLHNHKQNIIISAEKDHAALKSSSQKRLEWKEKKGFEMKLPLQPSSVTRTQD